MRILSKFRDFYDGVQRYGADDGLIYLRDQADGEKPLSLPDDVCKFVQRGAKEPSKVSYKGNEYTLKYEDCGLLFCGTFYPKVRCTVHYNEYVRALGSTQTHVLAEAYGITRLAAETDARGKLSLPEPAPPKLRAYNPYGGDFRTFQDMLAIVQQVDWLAVHQEYGAPVLAFESKETYTAGRWSRKTIVKRNPSLLAAGFATEKNAVAAYQEIAMYLGGVMISNGRDMVELNNAERITKHGFDEWSFRRPPTKHK